MPPRWSGLTSSRYARVAWLVFVFLALLNSSLTAVTIAPGRASFTFVWSGKTIPVWTYRPANATAANTPVVIVCHGTNRNASFYRDSWISQADVRGCIIVAPEFNETEFPDANSYSIGGMRGADGSLRPPAEWTFNAIEAIFDEVRAGLGAGARETYLLYGHSAGAQFVHRMLLFAPTVRAAKAVAANAGWYTVPETAENFPFGLAGPSYSPAALRERLAQPHAILLGTADDDPNSPDLNHSAGAEAQGPHRLARGQYFHAHATAAAPGLGTTFNWQLSYAPGVGHDTSRMTPYASALLFSAEPYFPPDAEIEEPDSPVLTLESASYRVSFNHAFTSSAAPASLAWEDAVTVPGWFLHQNALGTPTAVTVQTSLSNTDSGFLGFLASTDMPNNFLLGVRPSDNTAGSVGTGAGIYFGLRLRNQTGFTITQFSLGYTAGQFYRSTGANNNTIVVAYNHQRLSQSTSLTTGTWTTIPALSYTVPLNGNGQPSGTTVNFNLPGNHTVFEPVTIGGLSLAPGNDLWIRWYVANLSGVDQGVGIDHVTFAVTGYAPAAAVILGQPQSRAAVVGETVMLAVEAVGVPAPTYQWKKDGVVLPGERAASLTLSNLTFSAAGSYTVVVTNASGTVLSQPAVLAVRRPFERWAENAGLAGQAATPDADPDADGRTNLVEYALGSDPARADAGAATALAWGAEGWIFRFHRAADTAADTAVAVQVSADLQEWITWRELAADAVGEQVIVIPLGTEGRRFVRLQVTWTGAP